MTTHGLTTWNDGRARTAIIEFVERVTQKGGPGYVPPSDRIAVFDNDGTLWCEKPMPIELGFILARLAEMAEHDETLRTRQPWQAAHERDYAWLDEAVTKHYQGDDGDVKVLIGALVAAFAGRTVEEYADAAGEYLRFGVHSTLGRTFLDCGYRPMIDLLRYLEAHGFANYIASGGDRDFMRVITEDLYGIPADRVIGSSSALGWVDDDDGGALSYQASMEVFDDGPAKPVRIWSRIGKRPILAVGNANGDIPMLRYAGGPGRPALRLLVRHDDEEREFAYTAGAEASLERAEAEGWTVVSCKNDWTTVFADGNS